MADLGSPCPADDVVSSKADCEAVTTALGQKYYGGYWKITNVPAGCYLRADSDMAWFNTIVDVTATKDIEPVTRGICRSKGTSSSYN